MASNKSATRAPAQERRGGTSTDTDPKSQDAETRQSNLPREEERSTAVAERTQRPEQEEDDRAEEQEMSEEEELREAEAAEEASRSKQEQPEQPEQPKQQPQRDAFSDLMAEARAVKEEMEECDSIIEKAEQRKQELQTKGKQLQGQLQQALGELQKQLGGFFGEDTGSRRTGGGRRPQSPRRSEPTRNGGGARGGHDKSIRQLILEFLEQNKEARTSEIRKYLQDQNRFTNPGVELSRMVKDHSIINVDRGVYALNEEEESGRH